LNVDIYGKYGLGTISTFYLKGKDEHAVPTSIMVDGATVPNSTDLNAFNLADQNCYYYDPDNYVLLVKAFIPTDETVNLTVDWNIQGFEPWMPIMPILGSFGFVMVCVSTIYGIEKIKEGEFLDGMAIAMMLFLIGFGFIVGWLWSV
jgi:hypothetical protein